jgi:penicillin-binding protein 2
MGTHGAINVTRALQESCNIFFYDVGRRLGIDNIYKYAKMLGLGAPTGIELPEAEGQIVTPELYTELHNGTPWTSGNVLQAAIGQMDTMVTPLQLANYASTIANKGKRMDLNIIKSVEKYDYTDTVYTQPHNVAYDMDVDSSIFDTVIEGMVDVSRQGTARSFFGDYPIDVACKTGSPQTGTSYINSTFIAFAPADDPQIAISVVIEKGGTGLYGAPVVKDILDYYFQYTYTAEKTSADGVLLP